MRFRHLFAVAIVLSAASCGGHALELPVGVGFEVPETVRSLDFRFGGGGLVVSDRTDGVPEITIQGSITVVSRTAEIEERFGEDFPITPLFSVSEDGTTAELRLADMPDGVETDIDASQILSLQISIPPGLRLDLHSRSGRSRIQLNGHEGDAQVIAEGGGDLLLRDCHGHIDGRLAVGTLQVFDHRGSLDLTTSEGTVWARIAELGERGIRLRCETPSMICYLPPDAGFDLDARTIQSRSGKQGVITKAFGVPVAKVYSVHPEDPGRGEVVGHRAQAQVHGGGPLVDLQVQFGHLSVTQTGE